MTTYAENDGRFPDDSPVLVRFPLDGDPVRDSIGSETVRGRPGAPTTAYAPGLPRDEWPWLPGTVLGQCGPDEWHVLVAVRELASLEDGSPAPEGTSDEALFYPACFRDSDEIKPRGMRSKR